MAFTYDLNADSGRVRLLIGDTVDGTGVLPTGANFSDEEIAFFLTQEGDDFHRAAAYAFETLAAAWSAIAGSLRRGVETEKSDQAAAYREQAGQLRARHGWHETPLSSRSFSIAVDVSR